MNYLGYVYDYILIRPQVVNQSVFVSLVYLKLQKIARPTTGVKNILEMTILQVVRQPVQLLYEIKQCVSGKKQREYEPKK